MIHAKEKYAIKAEESYLNQLSHEKWLGKRHPADSHSDEGIKRSSPDSGNISDSSYDATVGYQWIDLKERQDHLLNLVECILINYIISLPNRTKGHNNRFWPYFWDSLLRR